MQFINNPYILIEIELISYHLEGETVKAMSKVK